MQCTTFRGPESAVKRKNEQWIQNRRCALQNRVQQLPLLLEGEGAARVGFLTEKPHSTCEWRPATEVLKDLPQRRYFAVRCSRRKTLAQTLCLKLRHVANRDVRDEPVPKLSVKLSRILLIVRAAQWRKRPLRGEPFFGRKREQRNAFAFGDSIVTQFKFPPSRPLRLTGYGLGVGLGRLAGQLCIGTEA